MALAILSGLLLGMTGSLSAQAPVWTDVQEQDGIAYLLRKSPSQIMRFDLNAGEWLAPVALAEIPSAFVVDGSHFFIASSRKVERIDLDGSNKVHVANTPDDIRGLLLDGNLLFVNRSVSLYARFTSIDTTNLDTIATFERYIRALAGASIAPSINKMFGRSIGVSPSDITWVTYEDDGTFIAGGDSPHHGTYPGATRTWVFPDETKVVDNSGTIYNTSDLTFNNSFGMSLTDIAFHGIDIPIVLKDHELIAYTNTLLESGRYELSRPAQSLVVYDGNVFAFQENDNAPASVSVEIVDLEEIGAQDPGEPISPVGLAYTIDDSAMGDDDTLYLLSKSFASIFRWDVENQEYIETIPLPEAANILVFSEELNRLYVYAPSRRIYRIDLDDGSPSAVHHATTPLNINTLIPLGAELMALQNGSWDSQWVYGPQGELLKAHVSCCYHRYHFYDDASGYLYYDSYRVPYLGAGEVGPREGVRVSPFLPLTLSTDGQLTVDAQGRIYSLSGPTHIDSLSNNITHATWNSANRLFSLKTEPAGDRTTVQKWSEYYAIETERTVIGKPLLLYSHGESLVVVTEIDGKPVITYMEPDLSLIPPSTLDQPVLSVANFSATAAHLVWERVFAAENYVIERRLATEGDWDEIAFTSSVATTFTDVTLVGGFTYEFRMKAINGDLESEYSEVVVVDLVGAIDDRVDPREVAFVPDDALISANDIVYLLSRGHESIFAWDAVEQEWAATIPLTGPPLRFTYSAENNALYTLHSDGSIYSVGLAAENPVEIFFGEVPSTQRPGLVAAGEFVIAGRGSSFDSAGTLIDQRSLSRAFNDGVWNPVRRNIYHLRDGVSPNDLMATNILEDGKIGTQRDSPYHSSGMGWIHPVRVDPQGNIVLIGSGRIFDAVSLEQVGALDSSINDAIWINGELVTLSDSVIYSHDPNTYGSTAEVNLLHTGLRLLPTSDDRIVSISRTSTDRTLIDVYDAAFDISPPATLARPGGLHAAVEAVDRLTIFWTDITGEAGYRVERRAGASETWEEIGATGASITTFTDHDVTTGTAYEYRIIAFNADLESEPSEILSVTLSAPAAPPGFTATTIDGFSVKLDWEPANRANGYRLERRLAASGDWSVIEQLAGDATSFTSTGLTPDTAYEFRLRAFNGLGESDWVTAAAATDAVPPGTPFLSFPHATPVSVTLSWSSATYAHEIVVERRLWADDESWEEIAVVSMPASSFIDREVESETGYVYRVKARNSAGDSDYSNLRPVTTPALPAPAAPVFAAPYPETATSLLLVWQQVLYAERYRLDYRPFGSETWISLGEFDSDITSFQHTGLTTGQSYEYRLAAWNEVGSSPYSLRIGTPLVLRDLLHDQFEPEENYRMWYRISGGMALDRGKGFDTGAALWFDGGLSIAETMAVDTRQGGYLYFSLRAGNSETDGEDYWRNFTASQNVSVQYSTNGSSWSTLQTISLTYPNLKEWTSFAFTLPVAARSATTRFRWITSSSTATGNWALDNLQLRAPEPPPVPWVDYVQTSALNSSTVHLSWPNPNPAGVDSPIDPDGVYMYQIERRFGGGFWETIGLVDGTFFPVFVDYHAPSGNTLFYRVRTLAPWDESLPSLSSSVSTVSQLSEWRMINFGTTENSGGAADESLDSFGIANIQRYAFGLDAGVPPGDYDSSSSRGGMPFAWVDPNSGKLNVQFMRRMPSTNPEVEYVVEFSDDLVNWIARTSPDEIATIRGNWEEVRFEHAGGDTRYRGFVRVRVIRY